jgi:two-component system chemotaxis response regulator CheB
MIVIGASLGGMKALRHILAELPATFPLPIAVVLHRHKESGDSLISIIQSGLALKVSEVVDKDPILPGHVHLSPSDYHLLVEPLYFSLSTDEPVQYARPSIDVLFESAADVYGDKAIGIILTGANHDGALGLRAIRRRGGTAIVQAPADAECPVMPASALETTPDALVRPVAEIAGLLLQLTSSSTLP